MSKKSEQKAKERKPGTQLTPNRELFCALYSSDEEFFGNGVHSYIKAFNIDITKPGAYNAARVSTSRLLKDPEILARVRELLDIYVDDNIADRELDFVVLQKADLPSKVAAIRERNKLKQRIIERQEVTHNLPTPILSALSKNALPADDSDQEASETPQED